MKLNELQLSKGPFDRFHLKENARVRDQTMSVKQFVKRAPLETSGS